ncbi:MAG: hypothetical protein QM714_19435 [Nocardioides sp.]|uniref:hypothetical protein n=1 Tax=Nocardioides sp. TaxID=35761 RepID=UPI0039E21AA6
MTTVLEDLDGLPDRLRTSAARIADLNQQLHDETVRRNQLIVQAVDEAGLPQRVVAIAAGISPPHLTRILAAN